MFDAFPDDHFPAVPYPGARPACSFVHEAGIGRPLHASGTGWTVRPDGLDLDIWLRSRGAPPLEGRHALLAYGSNACPSKITWLRESLGLPGPVVALRARCVGLSAVWAAGLRVVDDQRPATLAARSGAVEEHAVWLATDAQLAVLDVCEGRGPRYELARVRTGTVTLENGSTLDEPLAYVGASHVRMPLLVDGRPVPCLDLTQADARQLIGVVAESDGLHRSPVPLART